MLTSAATVILSELSAEVSHRSVLFLVPLAQTDRACCMTWSSMSGSSGAAGSSVMAVATSLS
jgi:hypothetical protein